MGKRAPDDNNDDDDGDDDPKSEPRPRPKSYANTGSNRTSCNIKTRAGQTVDTSTRRSGIWSERSGSTSGIENTSERVQMQLHLEKSPVPQAVDIRLAPFIQKADQRYYASLPLAGLLSR